MSNLHRYALMLPYKCLFLLKMTDKLHFYSVLHIIVVCAKHFLRKFVVHVKHFLLKIVVYAKHFLLKIIVYMNEFDYPIGNKLPLWLFGLTY